MKRFISLCLVLSISEANAVLVGVGEEFESAPAPMVSRSCPPCPGTPWHAHPAFVSFATLALTTLGTLAYRKYKKMRHPPPDYDRNWRIEEFLPRPVYSLGGFRNEFGEIATLLAGAGTQTDTLAYTTEGGCCGIFRPSDNFLGQRYTWGGGINVELTFNPDQMERAHPIGNDTIAVAILPTISGVVDDLYADRARGHYRDHTGSIQREPTGFDCCDDAQNHQEFHRFGLLNTYQLFRDALDNRVIDAVDGGVFDILIPYFGRDGKDGVLANAYVYQCPNLQKVLVTFSPALATERHAASAMLTFNWEQE